MVHRLHCASKQADINRCKTAGIMTHVTGVPVTPPLLIVYWKEADSCIGSKQDCWRREHARCLAAVHADRYLHPVQAAARCCLPLRSHLSHRPPREKCWAIGNSSPMRRNARPQSLSCKPLRERQAGWARGL
jgi:hypothetical protein